MKEYLYVLLYLDKFCYSIGNALIDVFGTVMLYKNGMPIYMILLIYGFRFGIMGLCSPLFITISKKFGIAMCALLANVLRLVGSYMILTGTNNIILFILSMSLPGALSNPMEDAISCKYIKDAHRGRYNSLRSITKAIGTAIASLIVSYGVINDNNNIILVVVAICFLLNFIFTLLMNYKPEVKNKNNLKATINYILHTKSPLKTIYSLRAFHIIERLFLPIYIYIILEDFKLFSTVIIVSLIIQIIPIIIIGKTTDKNMNKTSNVVSILKIIVLSIFIFAKNKIVISIDKTVNDNLSKAYDTNTQTLIQNITKNENEDKTLLSTIGQMTLCFTEIIVLIIFALIAKILDVEVFKVLFICSIIATILINRCCRKVNE